MSLTNYKCNEQRILDKLTQFPRPSRKEVIEILKDYKWLVIREYEKNDKKSQRKTK